MELIFWRIGDAEIDVEEAPVGSLGDVYYLQKELEEFLNISVDVVSRGGLKPRDNHIRAEALAL